MRKVIALGVLAMLCTGCYHATVETGRTPNGVTVRNAWAHSFIGGLVPPSTVEVASQCPNGIARVETQLSFLNMVASTVTVGIYTPMEILVACSGPNASVDHDNTIMVIEPTPALLEAAIEVAANRSVEEARPIYVRY